MWLSILATSLAGPMPEDLMIDDLYDRWEHGASRMMKEQKGGCWVMTGEVSTTFISYSSGGLWSGPTEDRETVSGTFRGVFRDGGWTSFFVTYPEGIDPESKAAGVSGILPFYGENGEVTNNLPKSEKEESEDSSEEPPPKKKRKKKSKRHEQYEKQESSASIDFGDLLKNSTVVSVPKWNPERDGVEVRMDVSPAEDEAVKLGDMVSHSFHPGGGPLPDSVDFYMSRNVSFRLSTLLKGQLPFPSFLMPNLTIKDAQYHIRGKGVGEHVLPRAESISLVAGVMGFTVGIEEVIRYQSAATCK